jgi:uncharacterized membrane protein YdjX (TVP38/TMEM64 family)
MDDQRLQVSPDATGQPVRRVGFPVKRVVPLVALAAAAAAVFAFGLDDYLTFEALRENRHLLTDFVAGQAILAVVLYLLIYAASTATSLPGGAILTVAGGFLFGPWLGTAYVVVAATVGATVVFLIARSTIGNILRAKAEPALRKMERGFQENALSYLLVLRLIPLFPFWLVNLAPALLGVPLRTYVIGTFLGIVPGTLVFALAGAGLGSVFDTDEGFSLASVLTPEVIIALTGLSVLSLTPVVYKKLRARG